MLSLAHMVEEFTREELEILDEMHAQLEQMHKLLDHQHAQFMAQLKHQRITNIARLDRLDQLIAQLSTCGKNSSIEVTSTNSIASIFSMGVVDSMTNPAVKE